MTKKVSDGIVISGSGVFTPPFSISNQELVDSFNSYVRLFNEAHEASIASGEMEALLPSSTEFIVKASGIESRFVMDKDGILDPAIMAPRLRQRSNDEPSILAEMAVDAARKAMTRANKSALEIDAVLVACSNLERPYPAIAIEVQALLGLEGFGFDMNVACSSATFALQNAASLLASGAARSVLIVNPEICSGHLNFRDRDSHFIFGDVATAMIVERIGTCSANDAWEIVGTRLMTKFSNNIRNNFGFLNRATPEGIGQRDKLFMQEGRKVFKDVVPMVSGLMLDHLNEAGIAQSSLKRMWLHQANAGMNALIGKRVLGHDPTADEQPDILRDYANTSSAGSIVAFHKYNEDLAPGDIGILCSFGAGYSAGSVILRKYS